MGIDMKTKNELVAAHTDVSEICKIIEADSLGYLSIEGLLKVCGPDQSGDSTSSSNGNSKVTNGDGEEPAFKKQRVDKGSIEVSIVTNLLTL